MAIYDFKRLRRLMVIYRIVQLLLLLLLFYVAFTMNNAFSVLGFHGVFIKSLIIAFGIQILFFYPALLVARQELSVNTDAAITDQTDENLKTIRKRRLFNDTWKITFTAFFAVFLFMLPGSEKGVGARILVSSSYLGFLLVFITYFQCFNFLASRRVKELNS